MRSTGNRYRLFIIGGILAAALLSVRYLLPLALPFLVGLAGAWMAEPLAGHWGGVFATLGAFVPAGAVGPAGDGSPGRRAPRDRRRAGPNRRPGPGLAIPPGPGCTGAAKARTGGEHLPIIFQRFRSGRGRRLPDPGCSLPNHCDITGHLCISGHSCGIQLHDLCPGSAPFSRGNCRQPGRSGCCRCCKTSG